MEEVGANQASTERGVTIPAEVTQPIVPDTRSALSVPLPLPEEAGLDFALEAVLRTGPSDGLPNAQGPRGSAGHAAHRIRHDQTKASCVVAGSGAKNIILLSRCESVTTQT